MSDHSGAADRPLFKTTIVIWSAFQGEGVELEDIAREATSGNAYCSRYRSEPIPNPLGDPDWDGTDFFEAAGERRTDPRAEVAAAAEVELVEICGCTNTDLEAGRSCGRPECPNIGLS